MCTSGCRCCPAPSYHQEQKALSLLLLLRVFLSLSWHWANSSFSPFIVGTSKRNSFSFWYMGSLTSLPIDWPLSTTEPSAFSLSVFHAGGTGGSLTRFWRTRPGFGFHPPLFLVLVSMMGGSLDDPPPCFSSPLVFAGPVQGRVEVDPTRDHPLVSFPPRIYDRSRSIFSGGGRSRFHPEISRDFPPPVPGRRPTHRSSSIGVDPHPSLHRSLCEPSPRFVPILFLTLASSDGSFSRARMPLGQRGTTTDRPQKRPNTTGEEGIVVREFRREGGPLEKK